MQRVLGNVVSGILLIIAPVWAGFLLWGICIYEGIKVLFLGEELEKTALLRTVFGKGSLV